MFFVSGLILAFLASFPTLTSGQDYPAKPITIYCGYAPGASNDLTARAMASGAEKLLGVPVVVENKPGGGATVCAGLVASKKPDGYTLGVIATGTLILRPHVLKVAYDPLKDFTFICQYARNIFGLCVLNESPVKTIDEFIAYARAHPGLSYGSSGMYSLDHLGIELFGQCKGITFKHIPTKGGAEAISLLLGKHTDFLSGAGQHIAHAKKGTFRMLLIWSANNRNPSFPNVPTLKEIGCQDVPGTGYTVIGPKGLPKAISKKLGETFKKVSAGPAFQKMLANLDVPYEYKDQTQMEKEIPADYEWGKTFLRQIGAKKEE